MCIVWPDDVKVDFASGLCLMSRSIHDLPLYLVTTAPGYLVTGSYQMSAACQTMLGMSPPYFLIVSS